MQVVFSTAIQSARLPTAPMGALGIVEYSKILVQARDGGATMRWYTGALGASGKRWENAG